MQLKAEALAKPSPGFGHWGRVFLSSLGNGALVFPPWDVMISPWQRKDSTVWACIG